LKLGFIIAVLQFSRSEQVFNCYNLKGTVRLVIILLVWERLVHGLLDL